MTDKTRVRTAPERIFIVPADSDLAKTISEMDKATHEWEMSAARGECAWICADCCMTFAAGMPDQCEHGHQGCTDIIKRDKAKATGTASPPEARAADKGEGAPNA